MGSVIRRNSRDPGSAKAHPLVGIEDPDSRGRSGTSDKEARITVGRAREVLIDVEKTKKQRPPNGREKAGEKKPGAQVAARSSRRKRK